MKKKARQEEMKALLVTKRATEKEKKYKGVVFA